MPLNSTKLSFAQFIFPKAISLNEPIESLINHDSIEVVDVSPKEVSLQLLNPVTNQTVKNKRNQKSVEELLKIQCPKEEVVVKSKNVCCLDQLLLLLSFLLLLFLQMELET